MRAKWPIIVVLAGIFAILYSISGPFVAHRLKSKLTRAVEKKCPDCKLNIKNVAISWFPARLKVDDLEFKSSPNAGTILSFAVSSIRAEFSPISVLHGVPAIEDVEITRPKITVVEKEFIAPPQGPPFPKVGTPLAGLPPLQVDRVSVHKGELTYQNLKHTQSATVHVHDIEANVGALATRAKIRGKSSAHPIEMAGTGRLEDSGKAQVKVKFEPFEKNNRDQIEISLAGQNMNELNAFFEPDDGLSLSGYLNSASANLRLNQGTLLGTLKASYSRLGVKFHKDQDRSSLSAALQTWVGSLKSVKTQPMAPNLPPPEAPVGGQRLAFEPITKLLIRTLKESALKIVGGKAGA